MTARELHYMIWDGVVDWIKAHSDWLKDNMYSITKIKMDIVEGLDITLDEKELLRRHSGCVLCTCSCSCTFCPLYNELGYACTNLRGPYETCRHYVEDGGGDDIDVVLTAAKMVRDVPLWPYYNRPLLEVYEGILGA